MQANYRPYAALTLEGHWTVQLKNEGNFEGEAQNQPGDQLGDSATTRRSSCRSRNFPIGRLNEFQRHKVRRGRSTTSR